MYWRATAALLLAIQPVLFAQSQSTARPMCVAPLAPTYGNTAATPELACRPEMLSLKTDGGDSKPWPRRASMKIEGLRLNSQHKVVVLCDGKPQQTFRFKFSQFASSDLCLFVNDLYGTVQLWERRRSPWCRCE
jgi:hypothetical protein